MTMKRSLMMASAVIALALPAMAPTTVAAAQERGRDRAESSSRAERPARQARQARSERASSAQPRRETPREARPPRAERPQRPERPRAERPVQADRPVSRPERRAERPDRPDRTDTGQNRGGDLGNGQRPDRPNRPEAGQDRADRSQWRRPDRPERPGRSDTVRPGLDGRGQGDGNRGERNRGDRWQNRDRDSRSNNRDRAQPPRNYDGRRDQRRREYRRQLERQWNRDVWLRDWRYRHGYDWWRRNDWFGAYSGYRVGFYYAPGYGYWQVPNAYYNRTWREGEFLPEAFWRYRLNDYRSYGLPLPPEGTRWVHVDNHLYLIDEYDGYIVDVIRDAWRW